MPQNEGLRRWFPEKRSSSKSNSTRGDTTRRIAEGAYKNTGRNNTERSPLERSKAHIDSILGNFTSSVSRSNQDVMRQSKICQMLNNVKDALPHIYQQGNDTIVHRFLERIDVQKLRQASDHDINYLCNLSRKLKGRSQDQILGDTVERINLINEEAQGTTRRLNTQLIGALLLD